MKTKTILLVITVFIVFLASYLFLLANKKQVSNFIPNRIQNNSNSNLNKQGQINVIAQDLNVPWEILFLPNNEILLTERNGTIMLINQEKKIIIEIEDVKSVGEAGLLGMALDPAFNVNNYIYIYIILLKNQVL